MKFANLRVSHWRQFNEVNLAFHPRVTIITGANGAGKSTLLKILSQHFGWASSLLGTPRGNANGASLYWYLDWDDEQTLTHPSMPGRGVALTPIGTLAYANGQETALNVPISGSATYQVQIARQQVVAGLFIGSHRPVVGYQPVTNIPTSSIGAQQAYQQYHQETLQRYNSGYTQYSATYRMKEAIISMATFGPGNRNLAGNPELEKTFEDFEAALRLVLPETLGFQKLIVKIPDIILVTATGEFVLDASSGGIMSLIDLVWQIFLYSRGKSEFTVVLDEPENHLHPSMQRSILQSLVKAFPDAQFIIATHSPFVVSSVKDASVYVLRYDIEATRSVRTVSSLLLDQFSRAGTASEILREALGVPVTMPMWAEEELRQITLDFRINKLSEASIDELRRRLQNAGLEEFYPEALSQVARQA